jgi:hypothetical protein
MGFALEQWQRATTTLRTAAQVADDARKAVELAQGILDAVAPLFPGHGRDSD